MNLKIIRKDKTEISTIGDLLINDNFFCYTLEDCEREIIGVPVSQWKVLGKTAIPRGIYDIELDFSERFQRILPHIMYVPGFSGVRIHPGNVSAQTEGCILVGMTKAIDFIGESKKAFGLLMEQFLIAHSNTEKIKIEVV